MHYKEKTKIQQKVAVIPRGIEKKRETPRPECEEQLRQASGSVQSTVADARPGSDLNHLTRNAEVTVDSASSNYASQDPTEGESAVWGIATAERTHRTFELAGKIGKRSLSILLDSGSTGNFVSARVCTAAKIRIEKDGHPEELRMADGSTVKTEGRVKIQLRCGEYRGTVQAKVFPGLQKGMILGMPWFQKENPHINWTEGTVLVQQDRKWVQLPLQKMKEPAVQAVNIISAKQASRIIRKKQTDRAFIGFIRKVEACTEGSEEVQQENTTDKWQSDLPAAVREVLQEYDDVFPDDLPKGIPPIRRGFQFKIELEDNVPPVHRPLYKLSPLELEEAKKQIQYMLEHGFIRPSQSPYGAPILFVPKKDGGLRFCIDYRWLNKKTVKNRYPLPLPEEMFDRLGRAKVFSKIDLKSGYWQIPVRPEDVSKTAFRTRWGLYEYVVMPFGLTNAPAQFMDMMNVLLGEYLDKFVLVFLDDILIYSASIEEHVEHLQKVLQTLRDERLYAKASKCEMVKTSVEFLGQQIDNQGMTPTEAKLKAVRAWSRPQNVSEVRSFLGFANYYRR